MRFGHTLLKLDFATPEQIVECLKVQSKLAEQGVSKKLGEIMIEKGYLTQKQVEDALAYQHGRPIALDEQLESLVGKILGGCKVIELIGKGAMADVYRAQHLGLDRPVAIKLMSVDRVDKIFLKRLLFEARTIAKLDHQNIVQVYDVGVQDKWLFIVMQLLKGQTLHRKIEELGGVGIEEAINICMQVARGLMAAHSRGIIHRDLKPENIMITEEGAAKITDFGLAHDIRIRDDMEGFIAGTPYYMAPEQWLGYTPDERADLYSLGVILYLMVTGERPFKADSISQMMRQHIKNMPEEPKHLALGVSDGLNAVIMKLLQKSPSKRYQNAGELISDLERVAEGRVPKAMEELAKIVICNFCKEPNPSTLATCRVCGESLVRVETEVEFELEKGEIKCPNCGKIFKSSLRMCPYCKIKLCSRCRKRIAVAKGLCTYCISSPTT
jgi:tRNA A-37 threonylcarbamoyl transferase component Bud32/ribosomal protein L40E